MNTRSGFQRNFHIFVNEDTGFDVGQQPTGYVKIEVREGKGRLHAVVQNLRAGDGRFEYILYLLCSGRDTVEPVRVGRLESSFTKSELAWIFDPHNVGQSGYPIDAFDVIAVLAEYAHRQGGSVLCPLAAYRNKRVQWRSKFMTSFMKEKLQPDKNAAEAVSDDIMTDNNRINKSIAMEGSVLGITDDSAQPSQPQQQLQPSQLPQPEQPAQPEQHAQPSQPQQPPQFEQPVQPAQPQQPSQPLQPEQPLQPSQPLQPEQPEQPAQRDQPAQQELNNINTGCVYLNGNMCGAFVQNESIMPNPCSTCRISHGERPVESQLPSDLSKLRAVLDNNFEESDPFRSKRSDYIWWKVTNPVNLNNILYQNNIRSPLMFNPVVMMAHYKYRHLIIGIFSHMNGRKYVVCGVPGMHMVDRKPFGELSTWVQTERSRPQYGTFGYWLVYINPSDGKLLDLSLQ